VFHTIVRWHILGEVVSECTVHNNLVLAIFMLKIIKVSVNLTKLRQKQFWLFFETWYVMLFYCVAFHLNCVLYVAVLSVDEVYHLASPASPPHYMYNPIKTIKTNTIGTINMLGKTKLALLVCRHWIQMITHCHSWKLWFYVLFGCNEHLLL